MTAVDELVGFLKARLDDAEQDSRVLLTREGQSLVVLRLARERLAEVEAKQRILAQYEAVCDEVRHPVSAEHRTNARARQHQLDQVLPLLALPYAEHADYRNEWRP